MFRIIDPPNSNGYGNPTDDFFIPPIEFRGDLIIYPYSYRESATSYGYPFIRLSNRIPLFTYILQFLRPRINHWWRNIYKNRLSDHSLYDFRMLLTWNNQPGCTLRGKSREFLIKREIRHIESTLEISIKIICKKTIKNVIFFNLLEVDSSKNHNFVFNNLPKEFEVLTSCRPSVFGDVKCYKVNCNTSIIRRGTEYKVSFKVMGEL